MRAVLSLIALMGIGDEVYEVLRRKREVRLVRMSQSNVVGFEGTI